MGVYINIGNAGFRSVRNGGYVDKSGLIANVNGTLFTERRFSCVSRSRRFGKSAAAKMLCVYYDQSCNSPQVFAGVYMTGILPFKKCKTESAPNNFTGCSMVEPGRMASYFGLTKAEVMDLTHKHGVDFNELEKWYDGYQIGDEPSIFKPNSVMQTVGSGRCRCFWASNGDNDSVAHYIQMNYEGLKDDVLNMLAGERCAVDPAGIQNGMSVICSKDDVLAVLKHLGYLSYDWKENECYIPNRDVIGEMVNAVKISNWSRVANAIEKSKQLLLSTIACDESIVACGMDTVHDENTSILSCDDENSLACVLSIAYYFASNDYVIHCELAIGKGFADIVLVPHKNVDSPAIVIELKYNKAVDTSIDQIKRKQYPAKVAQYTGNLLLVVITYNRDTKQHECCIERIR